MNTTSKYFGFKDSAQIDALMKEYLGRDAVEVPIIELDDPGKRQEIIFRVAGTDEYTEVYLYNETPEDLAKLKGILDKDKTTYAFWEHDRYNEGRKAIKRHAFFS